MRDFNGLRVSNPMIASTAFKYGNGWDFLENPWAWFWRKAGFMNVDDFGAFVTKTITAGEWGGNYENRLKPWEVIRIYPNRVQNRFGWHNCGITKFVETEIPKLGKKISKCIVSVGDKLSANGIFYMLELLNAYDICGIELNISCHNVNIWFLSYEGSFHELFSGARKISRHPLIVKICAESDYVLISKIAQDSGINLIHAINTLKVYSKNWNADCGESSYKNKEVALRVIAALRKEGIKIPIIGGSGIWTVQDIKDYENAGADLFSMSHQFLYLPFWPGMLAKKSERRMYG